MLIESFRFSRIVFDRTLLEDPSRAWASCPGATRARLQKKGKEHGICRSYVSHIFFHPFSAHKDATRYCFITPRTQHTLLGLKDYLFFVPDLCGPFLPAFSMYILYDILLLYYYSSPFAPFSFTLQVFYSHFSFSRFPFFDFSSLSLLHFQSLAYLGLKLFN